MKYKIKNVHKTLFIKERYQILSERNDNSLNNFSLNNWRSTMSIISEKTFEEMLKLNNRVSQFDCGIPIYQSLRAISD